jgi:hypothetical protein
MSMDTQLDYVVYLFWIFHHQTTDVDIADIYVLNDSENISLPLYKVAEVACRSQYGTSIWCNIVPSPFGLMVLSTGGLVL